MTFATNISKEKVEALLQALEEEQAEKAVELVDELTQIRESELYQQVSSLTRDLNQTLDDLDVDSSVLMHTKHDLPDITERLRYVMTETQAASEKTLSSAENVISRLEQCQSAVEGSSDPACVNAVKKLLTEASQELNSVMLAQSFQDLTGQVLNRVILIVTELEASLKALIERSKHDFDSIPDKSDADRKVEESRGVGPNVTAKSKADALEGQADVDSLLDDLGI